MTDDPTIDEPETDDLDPVRRIRPDRLLPDDPIDPQVLARERNRLMSAITATTDEPAAVARAHDRGGESFTPSLYPRLAYNDERSALEFLIRAFGFRERREARMEHPEGMLAWLEVGNGVVMIGRAGTALHDLHSPVEAGMTTVMVNVSVSDVDAHHARAVAEGARVVMDLEDMFWGDRRYEALDPEGHRWHFTERLADVRHRLAPPTTDPVADQADPEVADPPTGMPRVLPHLIYDDVGAAIAWLTDVFGFSERTAARHTGPDGTIGRTQMEIADSLITVGQPSIHADSPSGGVSSMLYVYVDDVDGHYRRTRAAGATIVTEPADRPWGDRVYQVTDPEGHQWSFARHIRDVDLADHRHDDLHGH
jgi:PhnB protein